MSIASWVLGGLLYVTSSITNIGMGVAWTIAKRRMKLNATNLIEGSFFLGYVLSYIFLHYPNTEYIAAILFTVIHVGFITYTSFKLSLQSVLTLFPIPGLGFDGKIPIKYIISILSYLMLFSIMLVVFMYYGLHQQFSVKGVAMNVGSKLNKDTLLTIKRIILASSATLWALYLSAQVHKEIFDALMERYQLSSFFVAFCTFIIIIVLYQIFIVYDLKLRTDTITT